MIWHGMVWFDLLGFGLVWFGCLVWSGMVDGYVWYDLVLDSNN